MTHLNTHFLWMVFMFFTYAAASNTFLLLAKRRERAVSFVPLMVVIVGEEVHLT